MKRMLWIVGLGLAWVVALGAAEPRNLDELKDEIRAYVKSGDYAAAIAARAQEADAWFVKRAAARQPGERLAAVFDLDETLWSNWAFMEAEDLGGSDERWNLWMAEGRATVLEPVRAVYRTARRLGITVFFLTGRRERLRAATEQNLRAIDCTDYAALIMKPDAWKGTATAFKSGERAKLGDRGFLIIASLGDQVSDLAGGHAERTFKFPDPFYFTP